MATRPAKRRRGIITNPIRYTRTLALGFLHYKYRGPWQITIQRDPCPFCGYRGTPKRDMGIDHVHPKSKGGDKEPDNIVGMCHPCNSAKSNTPLLHYMLERT